MMKHKKYIEAGDTTDLIKPEGESVTDKSNFRPEIASTRDKAINIIQSGAKNKGLYDSDLEVDEGTMRALSFARNQKRDITEVEAIKNVVENNLENTTDNMKSKAESKAKAEHITKTLETIAENTAKPEETTSGRS